MPRNVDREFWIGMLVFVAVVWGAWWVGFCVALRQPL